MRATVEVMWRALALICVGCSFPRHALSTADDGGPGDGPADVPRDVPRDMTTQMGSDAVVTFTCPTTYTLHDSARPNSHYRSVTASATWPAAETICEDDGVSSLPAHLIVLDDVAERDWAFGVTNSDQWAGLSDVITEAAWLPVTDQTSFYAATIAANAQNKDCVFFNGTAMTAEQCTSTHPYLCECDGQAADPSNF